MLHRRSQRGAGGPDPPLRPKNHKNIRFLCNTGPDPLTNHKATKPAFNVGPSSVRQRNAISMAFRLRADDGPLIAVFGSSIPHLLKKNQISTPSDKTFWIRAYAGPNTKKCDCKKHTLRCICCYSFIEYLIFPFCQTIHALCQEL